MPLYGTLDVASRSGQAAAAGQLLAQAWSCENAEVANLVYEFDDTDALTLIPPALHPAIPFYGNLLVSHFPESPAGAFTLAECRVMTRAGVHYGGYVAGAVVDSQDALDFLADSHGSPARLGEVKLDHRHYGTELLVRVGGEIALDARIEHPEPIAATDLLSTSSFLLAEVEGGLTLIQTEPSQKPEKVERGRPHVRRFDGALFGEPRIKLTNPLPATYLRGTVGFDPVRFLIDPTKPAIMGTRRL